jgi:nitrogen-specific signal transduction histidine kinase/CheY-like chemotaxis protein
MLAEREAWVEVERAARADLARVSRLKDEFLATLSHELRTPLTAMLGWAKVLLLKSDDPATRERGLQAISRNAAAQAKLIEDLLDMSRIISGKVRLDVQPTDLAHVAEMAVDAARPSAEAKQIRLHTVLDPSAGPVSGDPNRLQQVLWNLLSNAIKFTPKGGKVEVVLQRVDSHLELSVSDSGVGIAADFLPSVFDRFRQADSSTTRRHAGLGLGLSIVKQLVELHGGTVAATSPGVDRGATFTVKLPLTALRPRAEQAHPAAASALPPAMPSVDLSGLRILVVEDDADARELVTHLLRESGAQVDVATVRRRSPAGRAAGPARPPAERHRHARSRRLRADRRHPPSRRQQGGTIPAIALTAFARSEDRTRAMLAGYQVHVVKPIEPGELLATVASLVGRARRTHGP